MKTLPTPCPGCGYHHVVHHAHRADCTANYGPDHAQALATVINVLGVNRVISDELIQP